MKKFLLLSILFLATGACAIAQKKSAKQTVISQPAGAPVKKAGSGQDKALVHKNKKNLSLQKAKLQPTSNPAELKDERAN